MVPSGYCRPNPAAKRYSIRSMAWRGRSAALVVEGRTVRCRIFTITNPAFNLQQTTRNRGAEDTIRKSLDTLRGITWSRWFGRRLIVKGRTRLRREGLPNPINVQQRPEESETFTTIPGLAGYSQILRKMAGFERLLCKTGRKGRPPTPLA